MYRGQDNDPQRNDLHRFGKLFQQYVVDMYAKIESLRLRWIRHNQAKLRSDLYSGVVDAMHLGDNDMSSVGRKVILPSSFKGSPRHMQQIYQDAMSIVRRFRRPDLFITFTCNPQWPEIQDALLPGQTAPDRPDLTARVFCLKLKQLINDLTKHMVLGKVVAYCYTIEWQKRGLPHCHMLLILADQDKPRTPQDCDNIISAELPNADLYPEARETVIKSIIHGPCGLHNPNSPCMEAGRCTKGYPKELSTDTELSEDGYPKYRRRSNNNDYITIRDRPVDNIWVVPHNIFLCSKYDAHINVEICSSIQSIKYVYKYVYKGHDRASIALNTQATPSASTASATENRDEPIDEIRNFLHRKLNTVSGSLHALHSLSVISLPLGDQKFVQEPEVFGKEIWFMEVPSYKVKYSLASIQQNK